LIGNAASTDAARCRSVAASEDAYSSVSTPRCLLLGAFSSSSHRLDACSSTPTSSSSHRLDACSSTPTSSSSHRLDACSAMPAPRCLPPRVRTGSMPAPRCLLLDAYFLEFAAARCLLLDAYLLEFAPASEDAYSSMRSTSRPARRGAYRHLRMPTPRWLLLGVCSSTPTSSSSHRLDACSSVSAPRCLPPRVRTGSMPAPRCLLRGAYFLEFAPASEDAYLLEVHTPYWVLRAAAMGHVSTISASCTT
jgi:hypothetical protein